MSKYEYVIDCYKNKFDEFTWDDNKRTVGQYRKFVHKLLKDFEFSIRREIKTDVNKLLSK